jgi:hypothetical protein
MKATLDIPDELMRRIKMRAVQRNQRVKDTVAMLLEAGIAAASDAAPPGHPPKPVRLKARRPVTIADIETAIASARELKAFTNQLPYVDHRIGDRYKRKGLK